MTYFVNKAKDVPAQEVFPGIVGHLIHTERVTIGDFQIKAGTKLPPHSHPHEQTSTVLEGTFDFVVGGEHRRCRAGDVAVIPPNVEHSATAVTDCRVLDVFGPHREDYKTVTDALRAQMATAYHAIDCGFYDHFEAAITQRKEVELVYLQEDGTERSLTTALRDLKTENKEEFVQLVNGTWLRLDKVISLDGTLAGGNCSI